MEPRRRIQVSTAVRIITALGERPGLLHAISGASALVQSELDLGNLGDCVDLCLPGLSGEIQVMSGIEAMERVREGFATTLAFMIVEQQMRKALDSLLELLLAGPGGGRRDHPRVEYHVPIRYGPRGAYTADLEDISQSGLSMVTPLPLTVGTEIAMEIPDMNGRSILMSGTVVNKRPHKSAGFQVGLKFESISDGMLQQLNALLSELVQPK